MKSVKKWADLLNEFSKIIAWITTIATENNATLTNQYFKIILHTDFGTHFLLFAFHLKNIALYPSHIARVLPYVSILKLFCFEVQLQRLSV